MRLAERRYTVSSLLESVCGSQMMLAYSNIWVVLVLCKLCV